MVKILRAGGELNKYENYNLSNLFPEIFKNAQISLMKKILLNSNSDSNNKSKNEKNDYNKFNISNKNKDDQFKYMNFNFIIEEKEGNDIYFKLLKLDLYFLVLKNIDSIFYLNGIYNIDKNIIITKQSKEKEYLVHFGNKNQIKMILEKPIENKFIIKKIYGNKYLGNKKLIHDKNILQGFKKYNIYHFYIPSKKINLTRSNMQLINQLTGENIGGKINSSENNEKLIYKDIASQSSTAASSVSRNNLILYNRGNKTVENGDDMTKHFKTIKYILRMFILSMIILLIIEYLILKLYHSNLTEETNLYISLTKYYLFYSRIFCSILSLSCVAYFPDSQKCVNSIKAYSEYYFSNYNISDIDNSEINREKIETNLYSYFVDFEEFLFTQEKIMYQILEETKDDIIEILVKTNHKQFNDFFEGNLTHYKISQNFENNELKLSLKKEKLSFNDILLLVTSRGAILSKDIKDLKYPICFLNKLGENNIFINIYKQTKMNSYQENFYLLILDHSEFVTYLNNIISKIEKIIYNKINSFKIYIYIYYINN